MNPMPGYRGRPFTVQYPIGRYTYAKGLTLSELSYQTGIYIRTLSDYVNNRKPIQSHHLPLLAEALGVEQRDLIV